MVVVDRDALPEGEPAMISEHARGVVRIAQTWEQLRVGKTERGAFQRAMREAEAVAAEVRA